MTFPAVPLGIAVELWLNGTWTAITTDVFDLGIEIDRGRADEDTRVQAGTCRFTLNNRSGNYSMRNPTGIYYGQLVRNTPLRVRVTHLGVTTARFLGEVPEWPVRYSDTGADPEVPVQVEAAGVLRRLIQGGTGLRSALYRELLQLGHQSTPVAYWSGEDGSDADAIWSALSGQPAMVIEDGIQLGGFDGIPASDGIPVSNNTRWFGNVQPYDTSSGIVTALCLVHPPSAGMPQNATPVMTVNCRGTGTYWRCRVNIDGTVSLQVADVNSTVIGTTGNSPFAISSKGALFALELVQSGADVDWTLKVWNVGDAAVLNFGGTVVTRTILGVNRVTIGSNRNLGQTAVGHVAVFPSTVDAGRLIAAVNAHSGEASGRRVERLCLEESIPLGVVGLLDDTPRCGPQRPGKALDLIYAAVDVCAGILYEPAEVARDIGVFEDGTLEGWVTVGALPPTIVNSTVRAHSGTHSMEITWVGGVGTQIVHQGNQPELFIVGLQYTWSCWVYVPAGSSHLAIAVGGVGFGTTSSVTNAWQQLSITWTATTPIDQPQLWAIEPSVAGGKVYVDDMKLVCERPGLGIRTGRSLNNQVEALLLDFSLEHLAGVLDSTDDDRYLLNDVYVTVEGGSTVHVEIDSGDNSTALPPAGAGRYSTPNPVTRNVFQVVQALDHARWLAHLGTWNEARYPQLTMDLFGTPSFIPAVQLTDIGDRIRVTNPPTPGLPPGDIDQMVQGSSEVLGNDQWEITFNTSPYKPWDVLQLDTSGKDKVGAEDSAVNTLVNSAAATLSVKSISGLYLWTTNAAFFPIDIEVGGEVMRVTNITGTTSPQTFTVTRSINGVVKGHSVDERVRLARRATVPL